MELGLQGKNALVTGASRGIGLAIATALAREGCNVLMVARSAPTLSEAATHLSTSFNVRVKWLALDLSVPTSAPSLFGELSDLDILVNNAGDIPAGALADLTDSQCRQALELKLHSYMRLAQAAFTSMSERGGTILNVIGTAGEYPRANYALGSMANSALIAMTRSLGLQGAQCGVRVVGIHPGATETDRKIKQLRERARKEFGNEDEWPRIAETFPYGRLAQPEEVANCAAFLCSEVAAYINATCLTVDGGAASHLV